MSAFQIYDTVGELVTRQPALSRVFENERIDYCCGGKKTLEEVSLKKGIDPQELISKLEQFEFTSNLENTVNPSEMTLTELADHIEQTHHTYLKAELPRLDRMTDRVATVHGAHNEQLYAVQATFRSLAEELSSHMMKEERILFPMVRQIENSETTPDFHCGSLANPIQQMEHEHDQAGSALEKLRELTDDYTPPDWACNTYRAMLDGLAYLEKDMHQHVHKENNVLFPRVIAQEQAV